METHATRVLIVIAATVLWAASARAQVDSESVLHTFTGAADGSIPENLIFDSHGNLYGVATTGANDESVNCSWLRAQGCGVVFELSLATGGGWTETVLYAFTGGADGSNPNALTGFDAKGNLYGTALHGGDVTSPNCLGDLPLTIPGCGVVFELSPSSSGPWTESVLYTFTGGNDGWYPFSNLILDSDGNLYGETSNGGAGGYGVVYKLAPATSGPWQISELYSFTGGTDGRGPSGGLVFDPSGNLYGITDSGGDTTATCFGASTPEGCGVVFELTPALSGPWKESVLYTFTGGSDGGVPTSGVILDSEGNVYGAAAGGGSTRCTYGCGVIFELTKGSSIPWTETILHTFEWGLNDDGGGAYNPVVFRNGNLYGSTPYGGLVNSGNCRLANYFYGCGTVFELTPTESGPWTETILYTFGGGADGATPENPLLFDASGNIYSTTQSGGELLDCGTADGGPGCGLVFELSTGIASSVTLTSSTNPSAYGQAITLTATVAHTGTPVPTGTITFTADGEFLAGCSLFPLSSTGTAECTTTVLPAGANNLRALYSGDSTYTYGLGTLSQTVNSSPNTATTTTLTTSVNPSLAGLSITLTATITPVGSPAPTGTVAFISNNAAISGCAAVPVSGGAAACTTTALTTGLDAIVAAYSGDSHYTASGTWLTQTVNASLVPLDFVPVIPCRLVDTRNSNGAFGGPAITGGTFRSFSIPQGSCVIPDTAVAYSLNVTAIPEGTLEYLTVFPTSEVQPVVSTLNSLDGRTKANAVIIPAGTPSGSVNVYATNTTNVLLDINGFFQPAGTSTLEFYPLTPCRVADTRNANGPFGGPALVANTERDFPLQSSTCKIPSTAQAYSLNFTVVPPATGDVLDYLTVWPAGETRPVVSTLNNFTGTIVANAVIVPAGTGGGVAVYAYDATNLLIDVNGYFAAPGTGGLQLYTLTPCRALDTRSSSGAFTKELTVNVAGSACAPSSSAKAYVFNATVLPSGDLGYLTLWPDGETQPVVSTLNATDGAITSNMAIVPNGDGKTDAYAGGTTQLILDISAYFAP